MAANSACFGGIVDFDGARLEGQLYLEVATLKAPLFCRAMTCQGENGSKVVQPRIGSANGVSVRAHAAYFEGPVEFSGAYLEGQLYLERAELKVDLCCWAKDGVVPRIGKDADEISVQISGSTIGGRVIFNGAHLEGQLNLQGAELKAGLFCQEQGGAVPWIGKDADGVSVRACSATIGGQVIFNGAHLEGPLNLNGAELRAQLFCHEQNGVVPWIGKGADGVSVWASGATIGGQVVFSGAHLEGQLNLNGAELKADLFCRRTWLGGGVTAWSAVVSSDIQFMGAYCGADGGGRSLWWSGAVIDGHFDAADAVIAGRTDFGSSEVKDWVRFDGADFGGTVDLTSAVIERELAFGGSTFSESTGFGDRTDLRGGLKLLRTEVRGDLIFQKCYVGPWDGTDQAILKAKLELLKAEEVVRSIPSVVKALGKHLAEVARQEQANPAAVSSQEPRRKRLETLLVEAKTELATGEKAVEEAWENIAAAAAAPTKEDAPWLAKTRVEIAVGRLAKCEQGRRANSEEYLKRLRRVRQKLKGRIEKAEQEHPAVDFRHLTVKGRLRWNVERETSMMALVRRWRGEAVSEVGGCVNAESLNVAGDVRLNGVKVRGSLVLEDAVIRGELNLLGSEIRGHLNLRSAEVRGQMFGELAAEEVSPKVRGKLLLNAATLSEVMLRFSTNEAEGSPVPYRVDLSHAKVSRLVLGGTVAPGREPRLRLGGVRFSELGVRELKGENPSTKDKRAALVKRRAKRRKQWRWLRKLRVGIRRLRMKLRRWWDGVWIGKKTGIAGWTQYETFLDQMEKFDAGVFLETERWLRNQGEERVADKVYLLMRQKEGQEMQGMRQWHRKLLHTFLRWSVGFGVKAHRLFLFWVVLFGCLVWLFSSAESVEHPISFEAPLVEAEAPSLVWNPDYGNPDREKKFEADTKKTETDKTETDKTEADKTETDKKKTGTWGGSDAAWTAFRVAMPLVNVFARNEWEPSTQKVTNPGWLSWFTYEGIASFAQILSYIIWPLLITSWTGLLKKR